MRGLSFHFPAKIRPFLAAFVLLVAASGIVAFTYSAYYAEKKEMLSYLVQQAAMTADLRLNEIFVRGRDRTPQKALLDILKAERGMPLTAVDIVKAREEMQHLPWVKTVEIERRLPHFLLVNLTERKPIAVWQNQGIYKPIDSDGQIIETTVRKLNGLPLILGMEAPEKTPELLSFLAQEPELMRRVKAGIRIGKRRWNVILDDLDNGITVRLPESDPAAEWGRLARLNKTQQLLDREISMVDLRQPDKLIVHLKEQKKSKKKSAPKPDLALEESL